MWQYINLRIKFYFYPYFHSRIYLLNDLKSALKKYSFHGRILDVGCGQKSYQKYFEELSGTALYKGIDFKNYSTKGTLQGSTPDYYFAEDYTQHFNLPFEDGEFDHAVAFQVLEHHKEPNKMVSEMVRVIKPGGYIIITAPFMGGLHEEPHDYQRFTKYGLIELLKRHQCNVIEVKEQGGLFSTIFSLLNEYLNGFASKSKLHYVFSFLIYFPLMICTYIALGLDKIFTSKQIVFNYLILGKKN